MSEFDLDKIHPGSHIHFIGIGGISMSGLAQIMLKNGYRVTGSDRAESDITNKLEDMGATIFLGHAKENIAGADIIVYTAAVHEDNPEIIAAKENSVPLLTRAEFLGAIMKTYKHAAGIAGTHGKTTTTSMLAHALISSGLDPTVSVGGVLDIIGGNIRTGDSQYFVTEACEYTNSFLSFFPTVAVITNIDEDHLDFFSGIEEIKESFKSFAELTREKGVTILSGEDANIRNTFANSTLDIMYYGIGDGYDCCAKNLVYKAGFPEFDVFINGEQIFRLNLKVPGRHNVLNALAVVCVCKIWGADMNLVKTGIEEFRGAHRRFEKKGEVCGAVIIDDYAHHPTEIRATLNSAKELEHNRIWCIFQPHTYSRTRTLWNDFCESFYDVDELIITDIYAAREKPDGVTTAEKLAEDIKKRGVKVRYIKDFVEIEALLKAELAANDIAFTMGAGNVVDIADNLCK